MSDTPQGPSWWQASDGKWYPPPRPETPPPSSPSSGDPAAAAGQAPDAKAVPRPTAGPAVGPAPSTDSAYAPEPETYSPPSGGGVAPAPSRSTAGRGLLYAALGVTTGLAVVGWALFLTSGNDDDGGTTTEPAAETASDPDGEPAETDEETDAASEAGAAGEECGESDLGEGLVLVECGFSAIEKSYGLSGTYGFVIENTGDTAFGPFTLHVSASNEAGSTIESGEFQVNMIQPGQQIGRGEPLTSMDEPIGGLSVEASGLTPWTDPIPEGEITGSLTSWEIDEEGLLHVDYEIEHTYDVAARPGQLGVIFRNSAGEIVGGVWATAGANIGPGEAYTGEVGTSAPEDVDEDSTETYVDTVWW